VTDRVVVLSMGVHQNELKSEVVYGGVEAGS
jgi:hypothetical protein